MNRFFKTYIQTVDLLAKSIHELQRIKREYAWELVFQNGNFYPKPDTDCCNNFQNYRVLTVASELWCQFISHQVILESLVVNSLCLISKKLGSGALMETQTQPSELNEVKVLIAQLLQDMMETLFIARFECMKREIFGFLLGRLWNP